MDDATLLSLIEKGRIIAAAIVVLGVAGEFLGDFIASPIIKRRDDAQRAEIARLNKEAEDARKSAGEAIERAAKLEKDAAELNRKAEEEPEILLECGGLPPLFLLLLPKYRRAAE